MEGKLRVPVEHLRTGMFIHDLNCGWLNHPFARNRFLIKDQRTLERILGLGTPHVVIDLKRGAIPSLDAPVSSASQSDSERLWDDADAGAAGPEGAVASGREGEEWPVEEEQRLPLAEELHNARTLHQEAVALVMESMEAVREGREPAVAQVASVTERMFASLARNKNALLSLGRMREVDLYTYQHSVSVAVLLMALGKDLGLEREVVIELGIGGLLHDVGKIRVAPEIIAKPGSLSPQEFLAACAHVKYGLEILAGCEGIGEIALQVVAEHHERWDGSGYPKGLKGGQISKAGLMAAIIDVYDAVTSDRAYRRGEHPTIVLRRLLQWSEEQFEAPLVHSFIRCVGVYPPGTLVQLSSGCLGVVLENGDQSLTPRLNVFFNTHSRNYIAPFLLDTADPPAKLKGERIVGVEYPATWGIKVEDFLDV